MVRKFIAVLCLTLLSATASAQTYPDYRELYVNDFADLLSDDREQAVREMLIEVKERAGIEFTVVTIQNMSDYGWNGAIEPFATGLFNQWGVGNAEKNDGVMLLVARYDRKLRIEIGSGYSSAFDSRMKRIIDDVIVPYFKQDDYEGGIEAGVAEVIYDLAGSYPGEFDADAATRFANDVQRTVGEPQWWWALGGVPFAGWGVFAFRRWRRNRPRNCPIDGTQMYRIDEFVDDEHLEEGQRLEERLKSVDYDVWRCDRCGHVKVEAYKSWFSGYGACPECAYKTLEGDETILVSATTSRSGKKRIDYSCHHCGHAYSETRTIPKKSKNSSSSGGSSFGGGSSSGGGASGSW